MNHADAPAAARLKHITNEWPEESAAAGTHERVLELMATRPLKGMRILDVPCGAGRFSAALGRRGADVTPMDIAPVSPFAGELQRRVLADVNVGLPFPSSSFDAVVSIEGIEHFENPSLFVRECARVIRPGGRIFLTTPNVDSLRSRRYALVYGFHRYFGPATETDKDSGHLHPIDMIFMAGAVRRAGLVITATAVNRIEKKSWLTELLRPMLTRRLPSYMRGEIPFYGDCLIYVLEKRPA